MDDQPDGRTRRDDMEEILSAIRKSTAPLPPADGAEVRMADMVREAMDRGRQKMDVAAVTKKFDAGQISIIIALATIAFTGIVTWANTRRDIEDIQRRGAVYAPRVDLLENQIRALGSNTELKTNALEAANKVQDERLQNLITRFGDTSRTMDEIKTKLGQIGEDMASVKAKLSIEPRQPGR